MEEKLRDIINELLLLLYDKHINFQILVVQTLLLISKRSDKIINVGPGLTVA